MAETMTEPGRLTAGWQRVFWRFIAPVWRWESGALLLIVVLGGALRFHGLGWDQPPESDRPLQMHPDERFLSLVANRIDWPDGVGGYFDTANSPLNPYNDGETNSYVYGTFPLFLVKAVATIAGDDPAGPDNSYDRTVVWGRRVTAVFDTATILLVFAVGLRLFGSRAGLLGALLYALAVLPTQLAHFWTADPYLTFFATLTLLLSVLWMRSDGAGSWWLAVGLGGGHRAGGGVQGERRHLRGAAGGGVWVASRAEGLPAPGAQVAGRDRGRAEERTSLDVGERLFDALPGGRHLARGVSGGPALCVRRAELLGHGAQPALVGRPPARAGLPAGQRGLSAVRAVRWHDARVGTIPFANDSRDLLSHRG